MRILHAKSGRFHEAAIEIVKKEDWKKIKQQSDQFDFDWMKERKHTVYQLKLIDNNTLLGLVAIIDIPKEYRLHIQLIENTRSNTGKKKEYDFIAGCLIAHVCRLAFSKNYEGFVSLEPKTVLEKLYKERYGFKEMGKLLYIELENSTALIKKYL